MKKCKLTYDVSASITGEFYTFVVAGSELQAAELAEKAVKDFCDKVNEEYKKLYWVDLKIKPDRIWVGSKQTDGIFQKEEAKKHKKTISS